MQPPQRGPNFAFMNLPLAFTAPGWPEILFILLIILVLFGAKRLPELAKGLGQSLNEFKKARDEFDREVKKTAVSLEAKEAPDKEPHKPA